jgi:hypothetical protein
MAEDEFAPDEWDPPQLSRHMPFPPPFIVDVDVFDSGPLLIFLLLAGQYYRGWHLTLPWWYGWVIGGIAAVWVVNVAIRPQKRRLFAWIPVLWRYFSLWLWAPMLMRPIPYRWAKGLYAGGKTGVLTFILNREEGRKRLANVSVDDDGVIDTTTGKKTGRLMRFIHWLFAIAMGQEPLVRLVWVSDTGSLDLLDPSAREGVWAARQELLARPDHRLALYLRVRPFPVRDIVVAAGPTGIAEDPELLEWAKGLVQRRLLMAVPAAISGAACSTCSAWATSRGSSVARACTGGRWMKTRSTRSAWTRGAQTSVRCSRSARNASRWRPVATTPSRSATRSSSRRRRRQG